MQGIWGEILPPKSGRGAGAPQGSSTQESGGKLEVGNESCDHENYS